MEESDGSLWAKSCKSVRDELVFARWRPKSDKSCEAACKAGTWFMRFVRTADGGRAPRSTIEMDASMSMMVSSLAKSAVNRDSLST
jgi:hypothetical protein